MKPRPPTLAAALVLLAWLGQRYWTLPRLVPPGWGLPVGLAFGVLGLGLGFWSLLSFERKGTTHHPFGQPRAMVAEGPYRFSRNPMYTAVVLCLVGLAFFKGTPFYGVPPLAFFLAIHYAYIPHEERLMEKLFAEAYRAYRRKVRRWF